MKMPTGWVRYRNSILNGEYRAIIIGMACLLLFDLDKHYDKAIADLAQGKWKGSKEV